MAEAIFVDGCHGKAEIHMYNTKFHLRALYGLQVEKRSSHREKLPEAIFCYRNNEIHMYIKFCLCALYRLQV